MSDDLTPPVSARQTGMTGDAIDAVLAELAAAADEFLAEEAVAERAREYWLDESEKFFEAPTCSEPEPHWAVSSLRNEVTEVTAKAIADASRQLVAWWFDLATYAVVATARGVPIHPVRARGAAPYGHLHAPELAHLPGPSEQVRELAALTLRMGAQPGGSYAAEQSWAATTREITARAALWTRLNAEGELIIEDDGSAEGRRRRLWGDLWIDHQLPRIVPPDELVDVLVSGGASATVAQDVRRVAGEAYRIRAAALRLAELDADDDELDYADAMREIERLCTELDEATVVLAEYARTLTRHLPAIRASYGRLE
jgi:hypothetical protein